MTTPAESAETWARALMRRVDVTLPLYGSDEWATAVESVKVASCVRAAEAWRRDTDPHVLAARLDLELTAVWAAQEADYAGWREIAARVRATANAPTHAELQRRRAA